MSAHSNPRPRRTTSGPVLDSIPSPDPLPYLGTGALGETGRPPDAVESCACCGEARDLFGVIVRVAPPLGSTCRAVVPTATASAWRVAGRICLPCFDDHLSRGDAIYYDGGSPSARAARRLAIQWGELAIVSPLCEACRAPLDVAPFYAGPTCPACLSARASGAAIREAAASITAAVAALEERRAASVQPNEGAAQPPAEEKTMEPKPPSAPASGRLVAALQSDATDAAWRTAGSQLVKLTRDPLTALLCRHLGPDDPAFRARVAAFLQTELGAALVAAVLSGGLSALPQGAAGAGAVPERLARELRVRSMATLGDVFADLLMGPLREVASTYLRGEAESAAAEPPRVLDARQPFDVKVG